MGLLNLQQNIGVCATAENVAFYTIVVLMRYLQCSFSGQVYDAIFIYLYEYPHLPPSLTQAQTCTHTHTHIHTHTKDTQTNVKNLCCTDILIEMHISLDI